MKVSITLKHRTQHGNGLIALVQGGLKVRYVLVSVIAPEQRSPAVMVLSGLLDLKQSFKHMRARATEKVSPTRVLPEGIWDSSWSYVNSLTFLHLVRYRAKVFVNTLFEALHLAEHDKREAASRKRFRGGPISYFNSPLPCRQPVSNGDGGDGKQCLSPGGPDFWFQARDTNDPWAVKRVSHVEFLSVVEAQA